MGCLEMHGIQKAFSGVQVLDGVDLQVNGGQVLALLGENGAGKSTLMKILTGVYESDGGHVAIDGEEIHIRGIEDARRNGIEMIHQELSLFANLSIAENFLIGNEREFRSWGLVDYRRLNARVSDILNLLNLQRDPKELVGNLSVGEQQLVEIGRALQKDVRFLAMDEPTSALSQTETERLFDIIRSLSQRGVGIIYISHRLEELFQIADAVTVLRDGRFIATKRMAETNEAELVKLMVGRDIDDRYPRYASTPGNVVLEVDDLATASIRGVNLTIRAGEIVGLGGLMGSGRTEVARALTGIDKVVRGSITFTGKQMRFRSPGDAMREGIVLVTEDRKAKGLVLPFSVRENMALPSLRSRSRFGLVQRPAERQFTQRMVDQLRIKVQDVNQPVQSLSGGNQQKVVIGKWLAQAPRLFILDEPTRGVDVGAKQEIYHLMNDLKAQGKAVLMISSDLPELMAMSDRVYVMHEGRLRGELPGDRLDEESFMTMATGGDA